jgi:hypothetical protein
MEEVNKLYEYKKSLESEMDKTTSDLCNGLNKISNTISKLSISYPVPESVKLLTSQGIERAIEKRDYLQTKYSEHRAFMQCVRELRISNSLTHYVIAHLRCVLSMSAVFALSNPLYFRLLKLLRPDYNKLLKKFLRRVTIVLHILYS